MSKLQEAIDRLERAVARLEASETRPLVEPAPENSRRREIAGEIAARVDIALARIGGVLEKRGLT